MSLFGKLDAEKIPTNPYFVEAGEYNVEVTKAIYKTNRDGVRQLQIEYTITDEDSEYYDKKVSDFFDLVDPEMTEEAFEMLPMEEKKKIRRNMSALKRRLCGNDSNSRQRGLGISADDLNDETWDPNVLVGTKAMMAISNYGANNEGVNIRWVNIPVIEE